MKIKINLLLVTLLSLIIITGCSNEKNDIESDLIGEWLTTQSNPTQTDTITSSIVFEPNGNFTTTIELVNKTPGQEEVSDTQTGYGTFEIKENQVILTYDKIAGSIKLPVDFTSDELLGMNTSGDITFNYSVDGEKLTLNQEGTQSQIIFEKGTLT